MMFRKALGNHRLELPQGQSASLNQSMKIQATETNSLTEKLLHDIIQIVSCKSRQQHLNEVIQNHKDCVRTVELLGHKHTMVRRLAACLLSLVFEQKSDIVLYQLIRSTKDVCIVRNKFFLTKISPAIRNSRPEPLYHVKKALMYYLPASTFPRGLTCYLDESKLKCYMISKEYLRLPDPQDQVIWMDFPEDMYCDQPLGDAFDSGPADPPAGSDSQSESDDDKSDTMSEDQLEEPSHQQQNRLGLHQKTVGPETGIRMIQNSIGGCSIKVKELNVQESTKPVDGVHRIKCFQFFRKQKDGVPKSAQELDHPIVPNTLLDIGPRSFAQLDLTPPQFESVNDWATDEDLAVITSCQKLIPAGDYNQPSANTSTTPDRELHGPKGKAIPFIDDFGVLKTFLEFETELSLAGNPQIQRFQKPTLVRLVSQISNDSPATLSPLVERAKRKVVFAFNHDQEKINDQPERSLRSEKDSRLRTNKSAIRWGAEAMTAVQTDSIVKNRQNSGEKFFMRRNADLVSRMVRSSDKIPDRSVSETTSQSLTSPKPNRTAATQQLRTTKIPFRIRQSKPALNSHSITNSLSRDKQKSKY